MKSYVINKIYSDGYERFAVIREIGKDRKINVHFLQYDEYLESCEKSEKKKIGDTLKGNISIQLVNINYKTDEILSHNQEIAGSPHIKAVIEVSKIIDEYSIYAHSSISDEDILIEFEKTIDHKVGDKVLVIGSLEINEEF